MRWSQEFNLADMVKLCFMGRRISTNEILWRVEIPTEAWNMIVYGSSWPTEILWNYKLFGNGLDYPWANQVSFYTNNSRIQQTRVHAFLLDKEEEVLGQPTLRPLAIESQEILDGPESYEVDSQEEGENEFDSVNTEEIESFVQTHFLTKGVGRRNKLKALGAVAQDRSRKILTGRKRGRKPRSEVGSAILREVTEGSGGIDPSFANLQSTAEKAGSGDISRGRRKHGFWENLLGYDILEAMKKL